MEKENNLTVFLALLLLAAGPISQIVALMRLSWSEEMATGRKFTRHYSAAGLFPSTNSHQENSCVCVSFRRA